MRYYFTPTRVAVLNNMETKVTVDKDTRKLEPSYLAGGNAQWCSHFGKWICPKKLKTQYYRTRFVRPARSKPNAETLRFTLRESTYSSAFCRKHCKTCMQEISVPPAQRGGAWAIYGITLGVGCGGWGKVTEDRKGEVVLVVQVQLSCLLLRGML